VYIAAVCHPKQEHFEEIFMPLDPNLPHQDITYCIIGAAMRVHNKIGPGYREIHYQRALKAELEVESLVVEEERPFDLHLDGNFIGRIYLDLLVNAEVIIELKALRHLLTEEEIAQTICYLAATDLKVGLLLNFGRQRLQYKRILQPRDVAGWPDRIQRYLSRPKP
jgi:GxxExxY protein